MVRVLQLHILIILCFYTSLAQQGRDSFQMALALQKEGQEQEALDIYEDLIEKDLGSANLYHDLAVLYLGRDRTGQAVWAYEKCLRRFPRSKVCATNLEQLRQRIEVYHREFFIARVLKRFDGVATVLPAFVWSALAITLSGLLAAGLYFRWNWKYLSFISFSLVLSFSAAARKDYLEHSKDYAIVVEAGVELHRGPDPQSGTLYELEEGARVRRIDTEEEWVKVRLSNQDEGWIPNDVLKYL